MKWPERLADLARPPGGRGRDEFVQRYRLNLLEFEALLEKIRMKFPGWGCSSTASQKQARCSSGDDGPVSGELRLSMLLRFLAGGAYQDISDLHGVSTNSFYKMVYDCLEKVLTVEEFLFDGPPIAQDFDQAARLEQIAADGRLEAVMDGFGATESGQTRSCLERELV